MRQAHEEKFKKLGVSGVLLHLLDMY